MSAKKAQKKSAKKSSTKQAPDFEALVGKIEEQLGKLEGGELSLEQSLGAYEEGVRALKECHGILKQAEGKIQLLMRGEGENEAQLEEYDVESGAPVKKGEVETLESDDPEDDEPGSLPF